MFGLQICYFFYKNIAFGLTLFYFEAFTAFSGQSIYDDWYMLLFNVVLTSLPVISLGVFEQDVSSEVCLQVSQIKYIMPSILICVRAVDAALFMLLNLVPFCSSQHCISKDPKICSLTGIGYWVGWPMVFIPLLLFSSSILSSCLNNRFEPKVKQPICLQWEPLCSLASSVL